MAEAGEQIINLRKESLLTTLKLLGFPSIESAVEVINGSKDGEEKKEYSADSGYRALGKVGHDLESYVHLANIISIASDGNSREGIEIDLPDSLDFVTLKALCDRVTERTEKDSAYMSEKDELFEKARNVPAGEGREDLDFELNMSQKLSPSDWELYSSQVKDVARFLLSANYDLLSPEQREGIEDYSKLSKEEIDDKISDIIDTVAFSKAVDIEDRFTINEAVGLIKAVDEMIDGDEEVKKTSPAIALLALQKAAMDTRDKKTKFMEKYQELQSQYVKSEEEIKRIVGDGIDQTDEAFLKYRYKGGDADGR